jgi:trans-aconitate 2-methyltransferase
MSAWNPRQYLRFADERGRPCRDLAGHLDLPHARRIVDLGCGPGNSTAVLAARWPEAEIIGLDSSPEMLATAHQAVPAIRWIAADITRWAAEGPARFDIVFSNAALQWVPDHGALFPALLARVAPGGALAVQVPVRSDAPSQRLIRELAASAAWCGRFTAKPADWYSHPPGFYYDALVPRAARVEMWETDYLHVLDGPEEILEWHRGSGLRPFLRVLPSEKDRERFIADYLAALKPAYPRQVDGRVLFPFRRLFLIAYA